MTSGIPSIMVQEELASLEWHNRNCHFALLLFLVVKKFNLPVCPVIHMYTNKKIYAHNPVLPVYIHICVQIFIFTYICVYIWPLTELWKNKKGFCTFSKVAVDDFSIIMFSMKG